MNVSFLIVNLKFILSKLKTFIRHVKQNNCKGDGKSKKVKRAEVVLKRKIGKVLKLDDGSTLKIPKFRKLGSGSYGFTLRG